MKLTKEQRHSIYCIMLAEAENPTIEKCFMFNYSSTDYGFCNMLSRIFPGYNRYNSDLFLSLTELQNKKPKRIKDNNTYWFKSGNWTKRKQLLKQCAKEAYF